MTRLEPAGPARTLTERDLELLRYLRDGWSTSRIAAAWAVTPNTARTKIHRVENKLGVSERAEAVQRARDQGLI